MRGQRKRKRWLWLLWIPLTACGQGTVPSDADLLTRRGGALIDVLAQKTLGDYPKGELPICLARLERSGAADTAALHYLATAFDHLNPAWGSRGDPFFIWIGMVRGLYRYGHLLSAEQEAYMRRSATGFRRWFAPGTENHDLMTLTSLYLFAQRWPDARWHVDETSDTLLSSAAAMDSVRTLLGRAGQSIYQRGNNEFLSPVYEIFHVIPMVNLREFATSDTLRRVADAFLTYHLTGVALNTLQTVYASPTTREYSIQPRTGKRELSQYLPWLYFGQGDEDVGNHTANHFAGYLALSDYRPPAPIVRIGRGQVPTPYSFRDTRAFFHGEPPRYAMRSGYRTDGYLVGAGNLRYQPDAYIVDDTQFSITWLSNKPYNLLECYHNYYQSNQGERYLGKGRSSPFQYVAHHERAAVVLFNIPDADPFPEAGNWTHQRDNHAADLLKVATVRLPQAVDEWRRQGNWWVMREGTTYVGIRPFGGQTDTDTVGDFQVLFNRGSRVGFVFETGDQATYGSVGAFEQALEGTLLSFSELPVEVTYRTTGGDFLRMGLPPLLPTLDRSVPHVWVNGGALPFARWPLLESPYAELRDGRLRVQTGTDTWVVDWRARWPVVE